MRKSLKTIAATAFAVCCGAALFLTACSTVEPTLHLPPEIPDAHFVGNKTCYECHTNITRVFDMSPHGRFHKEDPKFAGQTGCESCHGPGSKHVTAGGGRGKFIVNPGKDPATCFNCHLEVHAQFNLPQHHPVIEDRMNCIQCHDPHGMDIMKPSRGPTLAMARLNETCANCHREQARPFVFEHEALREGCTVCHSPHGSPNRALLVERDNNLCLKCHSQVQTTAGEIKIGKIDHTQLVARASCWASGCHNAVHGSNVNPLLRF